MMKNKCLSVALMATVLLIFAASTAYAADAPAMSARPAAGKMLGKPFYWMTKTLTYDTLSWDAIERKQIKDTSNAKGAAGACALMQKNGKTIYRMKNVSAMSLIILNDLHYSVAALTQWAVRTNSQIKVSVPGADNAYQQQDIRTDYQWESIDTFFIQKPTEITPDFKIQIGLSGGGFAEFEGKEEVNVASREILGTTDGFVLEFQGEKSYEAPPVKRKFWDLYVIVDSKKKDGDIISDIEKAMDKLKLDMSYSVPKLKKIECK
jgi:hypothetical protein